VSYERGTPVALSQAIWAQIWAGRAPFRSKVDRFVPRALPAETNVESGTSQSKGGTLLTQVTVENIELVPDHVSSQQVQG